MLIIIDQYKEKVNLAASHGQMLEDEHAKVSTLQIEREAGKEACQWKGSAPQSCGGGEAKTREAQPTLLCVEICGA